MGGRGGRSRECENDSNLGKTKGNPTWISSFFSLNPQPRAFSKYYKWDILLINIETFHSLPINFVRYMDHLLIFGPNWAQNTIPPNIFLALTSKFPSTTTSLNMAEASVQAPS